MSERIKQLAQQAKDSIPVGKLGVTEWIEAYNQALAELIVRECILTIQMGITRDGTTTEKFKRSMTHIKDIKEHFGVEE